MTGRYFEPWSRETILHNNRLLTIRDFENHSILHLQLWEEHQFTSNYIIFVRIISLSSLAKSINAIVRDLCCEGIQNRSQTVSKILKKYKECGSLADKMGSGRRPVLTMEQEENDELTAIGRWYIVIIIFLEFRPLKEQVHCI